MAALCVGNGLWRLSNPESGPHPQGVRPEVVSATSIRSPVPFLLLFPLQVLSLQSIFQPVLSVLSSSSSATLFKIPFCCLLDFTAGIQREQEPGLEGHPALGIRNCLSQNLSLPFANLDHGQGLNGLHRRLWVLLDHFTQRCEYPWSVLGQAGLAVRIRKQG